ncbi:MAG: ParA family protein [Candidatus Omnitrophica bacterium]|nr:ParA family protein [Candidatus Omnitrophota bacterium]
MSKIIGICNQKGGTGKTTTAVNLTTFLALVGERTLLVDVDPQGNATSGLGREVSSETPSIYQGLIGEKSGQELIVPTSWENLFLIPSSLSLTGAEIELVSLEERESRLRQLLEIMRDNFDYIILDAPPSLGLLTINVLVAADTLIIPIQCEYYALEGVSKLLNTIELVKERLNPHLEIEGVLLTMADFRTRLTLQVIEEVKRFFKEKVFTTIIPRNVKLAEAPSFGKPILFYDSSCVGTKAYLNLTQEILKKKINLDLYGSLLKEGG